MTVHVTPAVLDAAAGEVARAGGELRAQATALEGSCESVPKIGDVQAGLAFGQAHYDWAHKSSASNAITDYTPPWPTPRACCRPEADGSMRVGTRALRPSRPVPDRTQCRQTPPRRRATLNLPGLSCRLRERGCVDASDLLGEPEVLGQADVSSHLASRSSNSLSRARSVRARSVNSWSARTRSISAASESTISAFTLVPRTRATASA